MSTSKVPLPLTMEFPVSRMLRPGNRMAPKRSRSMTSWGQLSKAPQAKQGSFRRARESAIYPGFDSTGLPAETRIPPLEHRDRLPRSSAVDVKHRVRLGKGFSTKAHSGTSETPAVGLFTRASGYRNARHTRYPRSRSGHVDAGRGGGVPVGVRATRARLSLGPSKKGHWWGSLLNWRNVSGLLY